MNQSYRLTKNADRIAHGDILRLSENSKSRDILKTRLNIKNLKEPTEEDKLKFWLITRYTMEMAKMKKAKGNHKS